MRHDPSPDALHRLSPSSLASIYEGRLTRADLPLLAASLDGELASSQPSLDGELASSQPSLDGELASSQPSLDGELASSQPSLDDELAEPSAIRASASVEPPRSSPPLELSEPDADDLLLRILADLKRPDLEEPRPLHPQEAVTLRWTSHPGSAESSPLLPPPSTAAAFFTSLLSFSLLAVVAWLASPAPSPLPSPNPPPLALAWDGLKNGPKQAFLEILHLPKANPVLSAALPLRPSVPLRLGDALSFRFLLLRPGHLYLLRLDGQGKIETLFPFSDDGDTVRSAPSISLSQEGTPLAYFLDDALLGSQIFALVWSPTPIRWPSHLSLLSSYAKDRFASSDQVPVTILRPSDPLP